MDIIQYPLDNADIQNRLLLGLSGASSLLWGWRVVDRTNTVWVLRATALSARLLLKHFDEASF